MATKAYKWRTIPEPGTEGNTHVFADSDTGSDFFGNGTRSNPYETYGKSYRGHKYLNVAKVPTIITCRGRFSESMLDGNHTCQINGDYYGAATFDGLFGTVDYHIMYGFRHNKLIIINTGIPSAPTSWFAGVGSANSANHVGNANVVNGVFGSSVLLDNTSLYWGIIGGTTAVTYVCYSRPKVGFYKISLTDMGESNTIYGCRITDRAYNVTTKPIKPTRTLFSNFDMYADEVALYTDCLFTSDCSWYYTSATNGLLKIVVDKDEPSATAKFTYNAALKTMTVGGGTGATKVIDMITAIAALNPAHIAANKKSNFTNCVFTDQTASQVFNNAEKQDFTLNPNGAGVINNVAYYGAFPPSLNVPIMNDSSGIPATWDENTADGALVVDDNCLKLDETTLVTEGTIHSKIVQIDSTKLNLSAIYTNYASKFAQHGVSLWENEAGGNSYLPGVILPLGRYVVQGAIYYDGTFFDNKTIVLITLEDTTFSDFSTGSKLIQLNDSNISNVVYVRTSPLIYLKLKQGAGLQRFGVYLNIGVENITYRGRTIVPNESFVAENSTDDFGHSNSDYEIAVVFDDTRVPSAEWVPAQLFGEYFAVKESGVIKIDDSGVPVGSGNYLAWQSTEKGGYASGRRTSIRHPYIQFKFVIKTIYDNIT